MRKEKITVFVDESYSDDYASVAAVVVQSEDNRQVVATALKKLFLKPEFITTSKGSLHYQEEGVGARQVVSTLIRQIPVSAYIAFTQLDVPRDKISQDELVYGTLLPKLLTATLQKYKKHSADYSVEIIFENLTDHIIKDEKYFKSKFATLAGKHNFKITVKTKNTEPLLSLPDYFLGFVRNVVLQSNGATWPNQLFELVADKFGVILEYGIDINRYNRGEGEKFLGAYRRK